jgi:hypothetical protein
MSLILTKEKLVSERVKNNHVDQVAIFDDAVNSGRMTYGKKVMNSCGVPLAVKASNTQWNNTEGYVKLNKEIQETIALIKANQNQFSSDYYTLVEKMSIDLTRRIQLEEDWTDRYSKVETDFGFSESVNLKEFLEYTGWFEEIKLVGDSVPLIEQKTGAIGSVDMHSFGLGHVRSLKDEIYNTQIFTPDKVNSAFARAYTNRRNIRNIIGVLTQLTIGAAWHVSQISPYVADPTEEYEERLYKTVRELRWLLLGLRDCQTNQIIKPTRTIAIVGSQLVAENLDLVLNGQLYGFGNKVQNLAPLRIDEIVVNQGDTVVVGAKTYTRHGMPEDKMVLFVPYQGGSPLYTLVKRPPTIETGAGDVLQLARSAQVRYFVQTEYHEEVLGSSSAPVLAIVGGGYGYAVVCDLPSRTQTT